PGRIVLEITESAAVGSDSLATLAALKQLGVRLAIDDFGTGYSSLSYLDRLPVDVLKIDRAFTARITEARKESALARAILALGPTLGLKTPAEGGETPEQWRMPAERRLLDLLLVKLVEGRHLLTAGEARFLPYAAAEVERAMERLQEAELRRSVLVHRLAAELELPEEALTMGALARDSLEPYRTIL